MLRGRTRPGPIHPTVRTMSDSAGSAKNQHTRGRRRSRAVVLEAPFQFREMSFPIPEIGADEFLVRVEMVGICGGDPIEYEGRNRKAHYPLLMGHEVVGRIETVGEIAARRHSIDVGARVV